MKKLCIAIVLSSLTAACGEEPEEQPEACDQDAAIVERFGSNASTASATADFTEAEGVNSVTLDASLGGTASAAQSSYAYLDLDTATLLELSDADALTDTTWDVAFNRSLVRLNSGDSGDGGLSLARVDGTTWESASVPSDGATWEVDDIIDEQCELVTFGQGFIKTAFGQWYDYDFETHTVSVIEDTVFFIKNDTADSVTKLQIEAYDDGIYTIRWQ